MDRHIPRSFILAMIVAAAAIAAMSVGHSAVMGKNASPAGSDQAQSPPTPAPTAVIALPRPAGISPSAQSAQQALDAQRTSAAKHPKLDGALARLSDAATAAIMRGGPVAGDLTDSLPDDLRSLADANLMRIDGAGRVQAYVQVASADAGVLEALGAAGASVERVSDDSSIIQAWIPVAALDAAASVEGVESIRLPDYGVVQAGSVMTEGDAIIRADLVRSSFGLTGAGVRIGVISDGVDGIDSSQASGDLPSVDTTTCNVVPDDPTATGAEGTAMLEIVHDIAPGAQLYFGHFRTVAGGGTSLSFNAAVNCLAAHTDVVVDDISFFNTGPYDGTGFVSANTSNQLNQSGNPVRSYSTSVGNYAIEHYQGLFVDDSSGYHYHKFQATADTTDAFGFGPINIDPLLLQPNGVVVVFLEWNDPFGASSNDYDLFLVNDANGQLVASSVTVQNGNDDPVEALSYQNTTGVARLFDVAIKKYSGIARTLDMFVIPLSGGTFLPNGALHNFNTISSSVPNQSDAGNGVVSVGAIGAADVGHDTIEYFSSQGPTNDNRKKPDVTGIDGVSVTGSGGFESLFYGTSAAAPHVAGVAALLLQCRPDLKAGEPGDTPSADRTALRNYIVSSAVDLGAPGTDNIFGSGRLDAYAAAVAEGCTDSDGDHVADSIDNCPTVYNPDQLNSDGGKRPAGPQIPGGWASNPAADKLGDACDPDDDNDGLPDASENELSCPYRLNADSDGDRIVDGYEVSHSTNACDAGSPATPACSGVPFVDSDGDGLSDCIEHAGYNTCASVNDPVPGWSTCANPMDSDGDGCADVLEVMDINGDRKVSVGDQTLLAKRGAGLFPPSSSDSVFDVNKDGKLSVGDQTLMAKNICFLKPWLIGCESASCPAE